MGRSAHAAAAGLPPPPRTSLFRRLVLAAGLVLLVQGCQRELDMGRVHGQERAATTIRYLGVRGETRLYPDYSALDAQILSAGSQPGLRPDKPDHAPSRRTGSPR